MLEIFNSILKKIVQTFSIYTILSITLNIERDKKHDQQFLSMGQNLSPLVARTFLTQHLFCGSDVLMKGLACLTI